MKTNPNDTASAMTKREVFAQSAMQGYCANPSPGTSEAGFDEIARWSAKMADAQIDMLNETAAAESPVAAEAAANDKAIRDMDEDKLEKLARSLAFTYDLAAYPHYGEEYAKKSEEEVFVKCIAPNIRNGWFAVASAAIAHLKGGAE